MANSKRFTDDERLTILASFLECDGAQIAKARQVAAILAEDEEDKQDAALALTFYYSRPENKKYLDEIAERLYIVE